MDSHIIFRYYSETDNLNKYKILKMYYTNSSKL